MPQTQLFLFAEDSGESSVHEWLKSIGEKDIKALANCIAKIRLLAETGHELRRPHADILRDGIYELRAKRGRVQYRILYFYHDQNVALLSNGLIKKGSAVPPAEIDKAIQRKKQYEQNPDKHQKEINLEDYS